MHLVHWNTKYGCVSEALKHRDGLAVLGIMLDIGPNEPSGFTPFDVNCGSVFTIQCFLPCSYLLLCFLFLLFHYCLGSMQFLTLTCFTLLSIDVIEKEKKSFIFPFRQLLMLLKK